MTHDIHEPETRSVLVLVSEPTPAPLAELHDEICRSLKEIDAETEILYLVRTSSPQDVAQAHELRERSPEQVRVLEFSQSLNDAAILSAGATQARSEILFTVPSRFQTNLACLQDLDAAIRDGADLAWAARTRRGGRPSANAQSKLFNKVVSWVTGSHFVDVASGTRAIRKRVLQEIPLYGEFHRYLPVLAERSGFKVVELDAEIHPGTQAPAFHSPRLYLWRAMDVISVMFVSRFTRYPLRLFGGVGAGFAAVGFAMLSVIGVERLLGTPLANRPLLVLAVLLIGLGVQAFTIGLLGELILFFRARSVRDYRVGAIYEADSPALPPRSDETSPS